jgi:hypothetical protein
MSYDVDAGWLLRWGVARSIVSNINNLMFCLVWNSAPRWPMLSEAVSASLGEERP